MAEVTLQPATGKSILFVVPAYQRVELATICYQQLAAACEKVWYRSRLRARILVISDDENLEVAARLREVDGAPIDTVELDNRLGARLNAGYRYAHDEGFDYVCAVGNDSFMHPDRFSWLPVDNAILCTRNFTCINSEANVQAALRLDYPGGVGSRVFPTGMFARVDYAPLDPFQMSGCDTGTLLALCRNVLRAPDLIYTDLHPAEVVGFQSGDVQVTKWAWWLQHPHEIQEPFHGLADLYGDGLVEAIRSHYSALVVA